MMTIKKKVYVHPELDVVLQDVTLLCQSTDSFSAGAGELEEEIFEPLE